MKFTLVQQAQVAKYTVENGNKAAVRHYSKEFCSDIKDSMISTWKSKYLEELRSVTRAGNMLNRTRL